MPFLEACIWIMKIDHDHDHDHDCHLCEHTIVSDRMETHFKSSHYLRHEMKLCDNSSKHQRPWQLRIELCSKLLKLGQWNCFFVSMINLMCFVRYENDGHIYHWTSTCYSISKSENLLLGPQILIILFDHGNYLTC